MDAPPPPFRPLPPDASGVLSWVHLGDLHMTTEGQRNHLDLRAIVAQLNKVFTRSASFAFLPGDIADDGSRRAYGVVRSALDALELPWCGILGDHDVHEKSFANFHAFISPRTHYSFVAGRAEAPVRFIALNAFDIPEPPAFSVLPEQLTWLEQELTAARDAGQMPVLLLHCYPSDLKQGGAELTALVRRFDVRLIDMGHTHYNEISNDGRTLYTTTRSTGQIEEGPVGFSVTSIDGDAISWRFFELGALPALMITTPADRRLTRDGASAPDAPLTVRARIWSETPLRRVTATLGATSVPLEPLTGSNVWQARLPVPPGGPPVTLTVTAEDESGREATDTVELAHAGAPPPVRAVRDQDNALGAWPEHGLLGTQLGPNKNGRQW